MQVWRIEDSDGRGPYDNSAHPHFRRLCNSHDASPHHPSWYRDYGSIRYAYVSGCASENQLRMWFYGFVAPLLREGFRIVTYTVPADDVEMSLSGRQLRFIKPTLDSPTPVA